MSAEHFDKFNLVSITVTDEILSRLSPDQRAMYAVLSLSVSELSSMQKILRLGPQEEIGASELDQGYLSQRFFIVRLMASKLLEVYKTLMGKGGKNSTSDNALVGFRTKSVKPRVGKLENHVGYELARLVRDKIGFHYDLDMFRAGCSLGDTSGEHNFLASEGMHSQLMPYGEIAVSAILGERNGTYYLERAKSNVVELSAFIIDAFSSLVEIFNSFLELFVIPQCSKEKISLTVPSTLLGVPGVSPFPLFFRSAETSQ